MKPQLLNMHWLVAVIAAALLAACASQRAPQGGPRDEDPPVFVRSTPAPGARNVNTQRIDIYFDENVQIKDVTTKVVVSPAQLLMPQITANGKRVTVDLRDSLIPNTTYTIDFSDAISDLNEGNIYDGFATEFATGDTIDSLRISGMIFEARTLEPAQGMLVGVYSNLDDSAITTLPLERIARTNQLGQFTIRGLKEGQYKVFAINDLNRDYKWDRSEDVAFYDVTVSPGVNPIMVTDTLLDSEGNDSLFVHQGVEYLPNDLLLTWFNEGYAAQYLQTYSRPDSVRILLQMAAKADSLPTLKIVNGPNAGRYIDNSVSRLKSSFTLDTLEYWITDPAIISQDSLKIETRYLKTDTADNISWTVDTLNFNYKRPKIKARKKNKNAENDSIQAPEIQFTEFNLATGNIQDVNLPLKFTSSAPLDSIDLNGIHLEIKEDTLWKTVAINNIRQDTLLNPLEFKADILWEPGGKYRLTVDTLSILDIYGRYNRPKKTEFSVRPLEDYSKIYFIIENDTINNIVVELLNASDKPVAVSPAVDGVATFEFLQPGTYYARAFIDKNGNGQWDTGNVSEKIQPEEVYYNPKEFTLKKYFEVEESWNLFELPIDIQKPLKIKKNKPKTKNKDENQDKDKDEEEDDWNTNFIPGSQYNDRHRQRDNRF